MARKKDPKFENYEKKYLQRKKKVKEFYASDIKLIVSYKHTNHIKGHNKNNPTEEIDEIFND